MSDHGLTRREGLSAQAPRPPRHLCPCWRIAFRHAHGDDALRAATQQRARPLGDERRIPGGRVPMSGSGPQVPATGAEGFPEGYSWPALERQSRGSGGGVAGSGVWCLDAGVNTLLRLGAAFDWVCVDMQHGRFGGADLLAVSRSWRPKGAALVVRVPSVDFATIGMALDAGARSVIVPQVDSVDDARRVVSAMYYPPRGRRSFGPLTPAWGQAAPSASDANATTECVVMIESVEALGKAAEIAAVDGVTGLFLGPYDLSLSLGIPVEELLSDRSESAPLPAVVAAARRHGRTVGVFTGDPAAAGRLNGLGFDAIAGVTDGWLLAAGIRSALTPSAGDS